MATAGIIGFVIWITGVAAAWFQLNYWLRDHELEKPGSYILLGVFSLFSWTIYPLYLLHRLYNALDGC